MFAFCFAMVPLYSLICKATGINTSLPNAQLITPAATTNTAANETPDLSREITVQFIAVDHMGLPWDFYPKVKSIRVHPGQTTKVFFYAKNTTEKTMTVQAIPSITPPESMGHFHKIECFCFRQQTLKGHESKEMPLIFNLSKDLPKEVHVITLAYTLFEVAPNATKKGIMMMNAEIKKYKPTKHYYIAEPSYWPLVGSIALFCTVFGLVQVLHGNSSIGSFIMAIGVMLVIYDDGRLV